MLISGVVYAQIPVTVTSIIATGKLSNVPPPGCASGPASTATVTFYQNGSGPATHPSWTSGPGSTVSGGVLTCTDPCDTTVIEVALSLNWKKGPDVNWVHGVFFPTNGGYSFLGSTLAPASWLFMTGGCTGINGITPNSCGTGPLGNAGTVGGAGWYFAGPSPGCCPGGGTTTANPCDNWGDPAFDCGTPMNFKFAARICNSTFNSGSYTLKIRVTADGNTGCWSQADTTTGGNTLTLTFGTVACAPLYNPLPAWTPIQKTCTPAPDYTTTLTAGCGNGNTVTWWTAQTGGAMVGTGSPFVYHSTTCPSNLTLFAQCCPVGLSTCLTRKAFLINQLGVCPPTLALNAPTVTQPTCADPTLGAASVTPVTGSSSGTVTYTLTPGGTVNTTGSFGPGLAPGGYTITAQDATGCTATASFTINSATTGGPGPTVVTPVNYCVGATASPLTAPGTNLMWYTVATGGTGTATAPTPSTAAPGTTSYWVSQNPTGTCESLRSKIDVVVTANMTITLTSAAATTTQTVCVNNAMIPITYSTANGVTAATVSGLPAGVTGVYSGGTNGTVTISGTPTATGVFNYTVTPTGTSCGTPTATGTITVSTASTLALTSAAATTSQSVCINTPLAANIVYTTGGGVTGATVSGLPAGITGVYSGGTNGTVTISGTPTVSGPFNYTVTTSGGCGIVNLNGTITVNPNVTLTLTSATATTSQTPCINTAITNITYSTANGATGATITGLPAGVTGVYSGGTNGTITISGTPTVSGPFSYTVTTSGGCTTPSLGGTITISPVVTLTLTSAAATTSQTLCINTPLVTNIVYTTGGGATGATVTGLPAGITGVYSGGTNGTVTISGTPTVSGPFNYTVTATGGCTSPALTGTITVNPNVTITLTSSAASTSQTTCINTALPTNIVYTTANGATGATVTGLPAGVTGVYSGGTNGTVTISGTPTVSGPFSYTVTATGGCTMPSLGGTITVNPSVTLVLTSAAATSNQTVNINTAITNIVYTAGSGATGVTVTGLPTGVTGSYAGGVFTISGTPTVSGTFPYSVTTIGGCSSVTLNGTIIINDLTGITLTSATGTDAQTICINTALVNITYALTGGATGASITSGSLPAGVTGVYGGGTNGTFTISGTPTVAGPFNYTISSSGGVGTASISGSITVNPLVTLTLTSLPATTTQALCINTLLTNITYATSGGATGATVTGLPAGVTGVYSGGTNGTISITGTPTVAGPFSYTVTTSGGCGTPSLGGTITVNPNVTLTLTSGSTSQTPCINAAITNIVYTTANGATGATITGLPAGVTGVYSGGTNGTVTISGTPTVSGPFSYTVTTTGGCTTPSLGGTITVSPASTITLTSPAATTSQTLCINTPLVAGITYSTGGSVTGATVTGLPAGITGVYSGGANGTVTISGTPTASGTFNYTVTTVGICGTPSLTGTITVDPNVTLTLTSGSTSQTPCINTAITNIVYTTANGATGATVAGLPAGVSGVYSGGTNGTVTISGTPTVSGPFSYTVTTSGGCTTPSLGGTITVNPASTITLTSPVATTSQTLCINTPLVAGITYSTGGSVTGATVTGLPAGVTYAYSGGANGTVTISGTPTVSGPFSYTVTTVGICGTPSLNGTITVTPAATITLTTGAATTSQTLCINTLLNNITYSTANGVTGATVTGLPAGVTGVYSGGIDGTITISGTPTISGPFSYTVSTSGGCGLPTRTGSITVNPDVTLTLSSTPATTSQTICINSPLTAIVYTTANGVTGITATGLPAGVSGTLSGTTYTISGSPTVSGPFSYTLNTTGGCNTASQTGTITVNPAATIALTSGATTTAQTICINTAPANIVYTTANGATGATATGLPAGVTGTWAANTFTISGTATASGTFNYTVNTTGGCGTATLNGTITVSPNVTLTLSSASANATTCINTAITNIVYTTANGVTGVTATGLPAGVTGTLTGTTYTISGIPTVSGPFSYTLNTTGGCSTATQSGTITVNPNATISLTSAPATTSQTLCINTLLNNIVNTTANGATGATVTGLPAGITGSWAANVYTISGTPTASGTFNYTVTTTGGCSFASLTGSITVTPAATITLTSGAATAAQTVCINNAITNIVYTTANGVTAVSATGLPAGVTGTLTGTTYTISGIPTVSGPFNYTVTTTGGCATASLNGTINVNANVTMTLTSAAATAAQTLCINTALTNIVYTTTNGATGVTVTGLPAGVTGSFAGGVFTISGSPTVSGPFNYTVTTTGGCSFVTLNGSITVNPAATIALGSAASTAAQTVCINTPITNIVYNTGSGATGAVVTGLPAGITGTWSAGVFTISGTPTVTGGFSYSVHTTGGCGSAALGGTVTVSPNVTLTLSSAAATAAQTVCITTPITNITYAVGNTNGATVSGLPAGVTGTYAAGVFTISGSPTVAGSFPYSVTTSGGCSSVTRNGTISVNPNVTMTLTSAAATANQTICNNTAIASIRYTTGSGATGATATGLPAGVTGTWAANVFTISGTATAAGTFNYTVTTTGGCSSVSLNGSIEVVAIPAAPGVTSPINYCPNSTAVPLTATGINLLWYTTATGGVGSTTAPTPSTALPGTTNYYVSQTSTVGSCEGARAQIVVNVNNGLTVNIGIDTSLCEGDSVHLIPVVTPPAASYTWRSITAGVPNSTITSLNTLETTVHPVNTAEYELRATDGTCTAADTVKVNVRWKPIIEAGPNAAICLKDSTLLSATISHNTGNTGITYAWTPTDSLTSPTSLQTYVHPTVSTWYKLTATTLTGPGEYGCNFMVFDSVKVVVQPVIHAFAGNDTIAMSGVPHQLHGTGGAYYTWSSPTATITNPNSQNATSILTGDANFFLRVQDAVGCTGYDSVFVKLLDGPTFYIPSAFTPDGDGMNDILRPIPSGISTITYFRVYNRYGQLMFETNQYLKGWDGTYKGKQQPTGTYVWTVKGIDRFNKPVEMQGTSMIIR